MTLADEDESVRIAVRALGDMRNSSAHAPSPSTSFQPTPALSVTSGTSSPSLPSPSLPEEDFRGADGSSTEEEEGGVRRRRRRRARSGVAGGELDAEAGAEGEGSEEWKSLSRVSNMPLVNTALRAYEHSKASSRVVKYGAEMMECSVKSISRPVIDRLPVGQLDEFACRQLDRLNSYTRRASSSSRSRNESPGPQRPWDAPDVPMSRSDGDSSQPREDDGMHLREGRTLSQSQSQSRTPTPHSSTSSQPEKPTLPPASTLTQHADAQESQQVAQRSRWQAMILEAGGISAAISEESMRRLKYCLQWLQYATAQIDAQILVLRNFIASLQQNGAPVSPQHLRTLQTAKRDVVDTIRQVVEVVSRYAGGALPEPARARVRSFILCLPRRWAAASGTGEGAAHAGAPGHDVRGEATGAAPNAGRGRHRGTAPYSYGPGEPGPSPRSRPASRATSPARGSTRGHSRQTSAGSAPGPAHTADSATQAAQKILTLATESLDMLRGVTGVFKDSLERADIWVERLRVVGLQRQQNPNAEIDPEHDPMLNFRDAHLPPLRSHTHSPTTPLSPFAPATPGAAPSSVASSGAGSGYSTPYFSLPRSASSGSVSSLNPNLNLNTGLQPPPPLPPPGFPGPLNLSPFDAPLVGAGFDKLSLNSAASSRFTTPKSVLPGLPPEGDSGGGGGGGGRGEKRRSESDEADPAVVAATALAGLAGSAGGGGGLPAKRVKEEEGEVGMDVDG
ncbi:transcription factor Opi1-domain-containing protein [Trametes elegans]|nr:transcription factor Opi1-domain-containing protein [Trametes elegans]